MTKTPNVPNWARKMRFWQFLALFCSPNHNKNQSLVTLSPNTFKQSTKNCQIVPLQAETRVVPLSAFPQEACPIDWGIPWTIIFKSGDIVIFELNVGVQSQNP